MVILWLVVGLASCAEKQTPDVSNQEPTSAQREQEGKASVRDSRKQADLSRAGGRKSIPAVTIVAKRQFVGFPYGIQAIAVGRGGQDVIVSDGSTLNDGSRLLVLRPDDLSTKRETVICDSLPWGSGSVALSPDGRQFLVFDRLVVLDNLQTAGTLDLTGVIGRGNVRPVPLAISPDGTLGLVHVGSYLDRTLDELALFHLPSGKLDRTIESIVAHDVLSARFVGNREIAVHRYDGHVLLVDVRRKTHVLTQNGPRAIPVPASNQFMHFLPDTQLLVVSGYEQLAVFDLAQKRRLFQFPERASEGNAIPVIGGRYLLFQATARRVPSGAKAKAEAVFRCVESRTGKTVAEFARPTWYRALMAGESDGVIYAITHDTLWKLRIAWGSFKSVEPTEPVSNP